MTNTVILALLPFTPHNYNTLEPSDRSYISEQEYTECTNWYKQLDDAEFFSISYLSDGMLVKGILGKSKNINKSLPVLIFNRGGYNNTGKVIVRTLKNKLYFWIKQGYVVIAPQYRGNDDGEGKDELGGVDVNDVTNLFNVIKELPYVDTNRIVLMGHSRGGMMALMALRQQVPVNAAILMAPVTDFFALETLRPDFIPLINSMVPGMPEHKQEEYTKRSAVKWADEINVPLIIFHGDADDVVGIDQSLLLADELKKYHKNYKLIVYPEGDHGLSTFQDDINQRALEWITQHVRKH